MLTKLLPVLVWRPRPTSLGHVSLDGLHMGCRHEVAAHVLHGRGPLLASVAKQAVFRRHGLPFATGYTALRRLSRASR